MSGRFARVMDLSDEGDDVYVGPTSPDRGQRIYGGQLVAQSLGAAQRTVSADRRVHSIHSSFLQSGDAARPVEYRVDRLRDGRSFSQRQVVAIQDGSEVMRSLLSFQVDEEGLEWQPELGAVLAPPTNAVPYTDYDDFTESMLAPDQRPWPGRDRPIDVRCVNPPTAPEGQPITEPQLKWMRVQGPLGDDLALHDAGLAYLSDTGMTATMPLPHGRRWNDEHLGLASLDHAIWFHRRARADEWLHHEQRVEITSQGRALARARFHDVDGQLVATCLQEGLMRRRG